MPNNGSNEVKRGCDGLEVRAQEDDFLRSRRLIAALMIGMRNLMQPNFPTAGTKIPNFGAYRVEIDGLRAIAVVAVIVNHFEKLLLPGGYLGVDIFFVISGYVITASLARRAPPSLRDFLIEFYARRIKRLAPALIVYVAIMGTLLCAFDSNPMATLRTGVASLFGLSNLYMIKQASDYFGSAAELNAFTHTWSLGVEEQFYLFFPVLVWYVGYGRRLGGAARLMVALMFSSVASIAAFIYFSQSNHPIAFFSMPTPIWELGVGSAVFVCITRYPDLIARLMWQSPLPVTIALVMVLFTPLEFSVYATIASVVLTGLLLATLHPGQSGYRFFNVALLTYVGRISYSLYLWHWGVIVLSRWTIGIHWWSVGIQVLLLIILAMASYHFIEVPMRRASWSSVRWLPICYGLTASCCVAGGLIYLQAGASSSLYSGTLGSDESTTGGAASWKQEGNAQFLRPTLLLIGDSHAGHLDALGRRAASELGMNYQLISQGATPFPISHFSTPVGGLTYSRTRSAGEQTSRNVQNALSSLAADQRHLIVLSSFYRFYWETPSGTRRFQLMSYFDSTAKRITRSESFERWLADLEGFANANQRDMIVLILSTPELPGIYPIELCTPQWFRPQLDTRCTKSIPRSDVKEMLASLNARISSAAARAGNIFIFDPLPSLCSDSECSSHRDGVRLYADEDHLTAKGAGLMESAFVEFVRKNALK